MPSHRAAFSLRRTLCFAAIATILCTAGVSAQTKKLIPIKVGMSISENYAEAFYANDMGFFKDAGLDAQITIFAHGGQIPGAVTSGALDVGGTSTGSMVAAHVHGVPLYVIAPGGVNSAAPPTTVLAVVKDSPISSAKDLTGKTIALTTLGDIQQIAVMAWLDANGGNSKAVSFIELGASQVAPSLVAGRIAAGILSEPAYSAAHDDVRILTAPYDALSKHVMITAWVATKSWLDDNTTVAAKFAAVMRRTADWAMHNKAASAAILAKYAKIPVAVAEGAHRASFTQSLDASIIQPMIDYGFKYKLLSRRFSAKELLYPGLR